MRRQFRWIGGVLAAAVFLNGCSILPTEEEFEAAPLVKEYEGNNYNKYTVVRGDMVKKESISAKYQGTTKLEIFGEGTGLRIKKVAVKEGQKVKVGDVLVDYYLAQYENTIKKSRRNIDTLELQIRQAKEMQQQELQKLNKTGGSKEQKQNVRSQYDSQIKNYESSLQLAKLDLASAKEEIEMSQVVAYIDGTVKIADKSFNGGYASTDDVLVMVEGKKKNRFRAKTAYANQFKEGQEVNITVLGNQYKATVKKGTEKNVLYFYPKTTLTLEDGVAGSVDLVIKEVKDVLYVPAALVYDMGDKKIVYMENEKGVKVIREVTVGERINSSIEILSGLEENDQIITN